MSDKSDNFSSMKRYCQTICLVIISIVSLSSQKYDYMWGFGYGNGTNGFGMTVFDWNDGEFSLYANGGFLLDQSASMRFHLGTSGAMFADRDGQLALMTNNCHIIGIDTDTLPNGSHISPSSEWDYNCNEIGKNATANTTTFLPNRLNDSIVYLVHRVRDGYWADNQYFVTADTLYMSTIHQLPDSSYTVVRKNQKIYELPAVNGRVIGIPTADELGWWVFSVERYANNFHAQRINSDGTVSEPVISSLGPENTAISKGDNAINISNDGRTVAMSHLDLGTLLYDFDRETGLFSNYRQIYAFDEPSHYTDGFCFSPSNRFLYVAEGDKVVQFDMEAEPPLYDSIHLADMYGSRDSTGWPVSLANMHLGPDCRIYLSPGSTSQAFHVIHYPDKKGKACLLQPNLPMPNNAAWNFPMITKFRMGSSKAEVCDSTIAWFAPVPSSIDESLVVYQDLQVYPNPSEGQIYFAADGDTGFDAVSIYTIGGKEVYRHRGSWHGQGMLDISFLRSGVYILKGRRGQQVWQAKVVVR